MAGQKIHITLKGGIFLNRQYRGGFFKFMLALGFLAGVYVFFGMIPFFAEIAAKIGFGLIGLFSLLTFLGIVLTDMSSAEFLRLSSRAAIAAMPYIVNGGAYLCRTLLSQGKRSFALAAVLSCIILSVLLGALLAQRYVDDDL